MRSCGDKITDQTIVEKVLRSLTPKFDHVVAAIEESKDLSVFSFEELMGSLQAHESRINRSFEKSDEKAFQVKGEFSNQKEFSTARGRGRGGFRGRGRGQDRGRGSRSDAKQYFGGQQGDKSQIQCHNCGKYGHVKVDCCSKEKQANYVQEEANDNKLFMAVADVVDVPNDVWFVDSGCSNHMCSNKEMFKELDESRKIQVRLGDDKSIQVEGKGMVHGLPKIDDFDLCEGCIYGK